MSDQISRSSPSNPTSVEDYIQRGWSLHVHGDEAGAEADFRQALSLDANSIEASYGLGMVLKVNGQIDQAIAAFKTTLALLDNHDAKIDRARATMLRHLSNTHINMLQPGA